MLGSKDSLGMLVQAFPKRVVRRRPTVWFGTVTRQSHVVCRRGLKNDGVTAAIARKSRCSHDGVTMKLNTWITPHP